MKLFDLSQKKIVLFGGAGYLGSATVCALLELNARVVVADVFPAHAKENIAAFEGHKNVRLKSCDMRDAAQIREVNALCVEAFGGMNTLINMVAFGGNATPVEKMTDDAWALGIEGSLNTTFRAIREATPFLENNAPSAIVNTSSMYGLVSPDPRIYGDSGQNNPANYGAAKAGVLQLTRYCAGHLAPKGIRVNAVTPGPFPDDRKLPPEDFLQALESKTMLNRIGSREEIAGAYCYLVSDAASYTTGANIVVDGGWTAW
ncbi:SDR family oxidoreductase [Christensenellaceae bacterium OttesenSCG-928-M15]|nr:SDR family oxidoreductase [Christensenellaceae bacterium OttesenSCG-928-M15]